MVPIDATVMELSGLLYHDGIITLVVCHSRLMLLTNVTKDSDWSVYPLFGANQCKKGLRISVIRYGNLLATIEKTQWPKLETSAQMVSWKQMRHYSLGEAGMYSGGL